jgi:tetratricopeptide (TPR) repeat protein
MFGMRCAFAAFLAAVMLTGPCGALAAEDSGLARGETTMVKINPGHRATLRLAPANSGSQSFLISGDDPTLIVRILSEDGLELRRLQAGADGLVALSFASREGSRNRLVLETSETSKAEVQVTVKFELFSLSSSELSSSLEAETIYTEAQRQHGTLAAPDLARTIELYRRAGSKWRQGRNRQGEALALIAEGQVQFQLSRYKDALRAYSSAALLAEPESIPRASALNGSAEVNLELWHRDTASELAGRAREISRKYHDARGEADGASYIAIARYLMSEENAAPGLSDALTLALAAGNRIAAARILRMQGWMERDNGHPTPSVEIMNRSALLFQETGRTVDALGEVFDVATTEAMRGDPYAGILEHLRLTKLFQDAGYVFGQANGENCLGIDYAAINRPHEALEYFAEARRLFTETGNEWASQTSLGLMCDTEIKLGRFGEAQHDCEEAERISLRFHAPVYTGLADWRLGKLAESKRQNSRALSYYTQAAKFSADELYAAGEASALISKGALNDEMGRHTEALGSFRHAMSLSEGAEDAAGVIEARYRIARTYSRTGELAQVGAELDNAISRFEEQRSRIHDDKLRTSYFAQARKCYDLYIEVLMRRHTADPAAGFDRLALEKADAGRARTLLDTVTTHGTKAARTSADQGLAQLRSELNRAYERRLRLIVRNAALREIHTNAEEIRHLVAEYDQAEALAEQGAAVSPVGFTPLSIQELLNTSPENVILEYHLDEEQSYAWKLSRGLLETRVLPGRKALAAEVAQWRQFATARQRRPSEPFAVYRSRVESAERQLPQESARLSCLLLGDLRADESGRLVVIADDVLQLVPFAALPTGGCNHPDGPPLVSSIEVVSASSIGVWRAGGLSNPLTGDARKGVAVLADPVFSASDPRVGGRGKEDQSPNPTTTLQAAMRDVGFGKELPRLNATRREAAAIVSAAGSTSVFVATDFEASLKTALSDDLAAYRIWHFATHGLLDNESPELSGIVFSLVDKQGNPQPGYLKIQDIYDLSISPDLVVLSACNSGLGPQVDGEGTIGLSYAFLHAGARQVISTLWNVDDDASAELMAGFYRRLLQEHLSAPAALRGAQGEMSRRRGPFYWAGYVLTSR